MLAVAPCAEPENVSFYGNYKATNLKLFFGHQLLSLPFYGTEGCPPFILKTANVSTNECKHLSINLFVPSNEEKLTMKCSKIRQPDIPDNTGKTQ